VIHGLNEVFLASITSNIEKTLQKHFVPVISGDASIGGARAPPLLKF